MISEKEKEFLLYWEQNREIENSFISKLVKGFPMALLFGLPIILSVIIVRIFIPAWFIKISQTSPGMFVTVIIAMVILIVFYSFFRMQYKWEMNEQLYKELKSKEKKSIKNQQTNIH